MCYSGPGYGIQSIEFSSEYRVDTSNKINYNYISQ